MPWWLKAYVWSAPPARSPPSGRETSLAPSLTAAAQRATHVVDAVLAQLGGIDLLVNHVGGGDGLTPTGFLSPAVRTVRTT
ncbi:hypothetical protein ACH40F_55275 [Streptomyces sp. NPDC020794]|uniref:hypothetical protein n=1 Tax=unclassified Streptomyces TaxID=2593676 RepID=UPI0036F0FAC6